MVRLRALVPPGRADAPGPSDEERTGALIRRAALPGGMDDEGLRRVWARLARERAAQAGNRPVMRLRWAVGAVLLLSAGAMAATGAWTWRRAVMRRLTASSPSPSLPTKDRVTGPQPRGPDRAGTPEGVVAAPDVEPAAPAVAPPPAALPAIAPPPEHAGAGHRPNAPRPPRSAPRPASPPPASQLAEESQFVSRALVRLRQARDAAGALAELERYAQRFPSGILEHEAMVVRVDALLLAGRDAEAEAILSRLTLASTTRERELRLIRAELATGTDCASALDDYRTVWNEHPEGTWGERALWGQAVCAARLGDEARARVHLTRYLAQFPHGPHAGEARVRLRE